MLILRVRTGSQNRSNGIDTCLEFSKYDYFAGHRRLVRSLCPPLNSWILLPSPSLSFPHCENDLSFINFLYSHAVHVPLFHSTFREAVGKITDICLDLFRHILARVAKLRIYSAIPGVAILHEWRWFVISKHSTLCELGEDRQAMTATRKIRYKQERMVRLEV